MLQEQRLENKFILLANEFANSCITQENFYLRFSKFLTTISDGIEAHAPLQTISKKQTCIQLNSRLTKGLLINQKEAMFIPHLLP